jgi:glutathione S-transferase
MLVLYHAGLTTCSKQVRFCLREKGLAYESRYVDLLKFEHLYPDYLELNPHGVVPTLVHDGHAIINSACINEYIDEVLPEPRLSPSDPRDRALMRYWTWTADDSHFQIAQLTRQRRLTHSARELSEADHNLVLAHMPVPSRRARWRQAVETDLTAEESAVALDHLHFVARRMDQAVEARGPWLAGATFSLADISMASIVHRLLELYPDALPRRDYPHVNDWLDRLMARPAAIATYAAGTQETPKLPPSRWAPGIAVLRAASAGATA